MVGPPSGFRPKALLLQLTAYGVDFVVIGGITATLYGSPRDTFDLDICPAEDPANLDALGRALVDADARLRGLDEDVPFVPDARTLAGVEILTVDTSLGPLDILLRPGGGPPYRQLRSRATRLDVGTAAVLVASIDDLIAMKLATGRAKDRADIDELEAIRRLERRLGRRRRAGS
jgi:hypothetical protein